MEARRRARHPGQQLDSQHRADARHEPRRGDQLRARRRAEAVGRHGDHPRQCEDRRPPSRPPRIRDLRRARPRAHALGRTPRVHRRGRAGRFHLRAALRAAPGNQRQHDRSRSNACCAAATARRWQSISTSSRSRSPSRCCGSTRRIRTAASDVRDKTREARKGRHPPTPGTAYAVPKVFEAGGLHGFPHVPRSGARVLVLPAAGGPAAQRLPHARCRAQARQAS